MIYRMSENREGPWVAPGDDAFDGRAYYAGRTISSGGKRFLFGWVPSRDKDDDKENYLWAGTQVVHEVVQWQDGSLGVKIPDTVYGAFNFPDHITDVKLQSVDARHEAVLVPVSGDLFRFEGRLSFCKNTCSFAVKFYEDRETGEAYQFIFLIHENRFCFETTPNQPWFQNMNMGLERPFMFKAETTYTIRLIVDSTVATMYLDDVALNARMYRCPGGALSLSVSGGTLEGFSMNIARGLK
jgi:beta-fructofuranosidase